MSTSAPDPASQGGPAPSSASPATAHFPDLHSLAVDVVHDLQALAVGLQNAGAADAAIHQVTGMAHQIGTVADSLANMPSIPNPAHQAQPADASTQPQGNGAAPAAAPSSPGDEGAKHIANIAKSAAMLAQAHRVAGPPQQ